MVLVTIVICMFLAIEMGKRNTRFGSKEFFQMLFLALIPTLVALYHMYTMTKPPLY